MCKRLTIVIFEEIPTTPLNCLGRLKIRAKLVLCNSILLISYPSITKNTLIDSINYARKYVDITKEQYEIILAINKIVLKNNGSMWIKSSSDNFDVRMGVYDLSQIADLVGLYALDILSKTISPEQMRL